MEKVIIPDWYKPLLEKIQKNLNEDDLKLLLEIMDWKQVDKKIIKKIWLKMTSWLWFSDILKFNKMLLSLRFFKKNG